MIPRILIIDDDALIARALGRMLSSFTVLIETDPRRAMARILDGERFDIVICDLNMLPMSGYAVMAAIRSHFEERDDAPHLIMTSGSDEVLALGTLADLVLRKPFKATELRAGVSCLLANHP